MKVVIIGAGPAGLITALNLLERGTTPLILEKQPEIKSTACGEALSLCRLNEIPFNSEPFIARKAKGVRVTFPGGSVDQIDVECAVLNRTEWLRGMAAEVERRGGEIRLNSTVVEINGDSVRLENGEQVAYHTLIGADGPNSCVARHLGMRYTSIVASQYKIAFDTSDAEYLEFYFDKRFSFGYAWVFPKDGVINVGLGGDFAHLDAFVQDKGLDNYEIIAREAGVIPTSSIGKLVSQNVALIGDAVSMPNPMTLGGLSPIIHASQILANNINNLEDYEKEVKRHPIANPVLRKAGLALLGFSNQDLANLGKFLSGINKQEGRAPTIRRLVKHPALLLKLKYLRTMYIAGKITLDYGW